MSAKDNILNRLRQGQQPFADVQPVKERLVTVPMDGIDLLERFIEQAMVLSAHIHQAESTASAIDYIQGVLGTDKQLLAWDFEHIPIHGLQAALSKDGIAIAHERDANVRVGITGVDAGFAATGSIVISAREGRPRSVSLLPHIHIAVITQNQILPHFDAWIGRESERLDDFRKVGNHVVITGASRTADIGMELVLGAHGPAELHLIIVALQ